MERTVNINAASFRSIDQTLARVVCSPRQFLALMDWLDVPGANHTTVARAWLRELNLDPGEFEYKHIDIVVEWSRC